jgi:putative FmdB family regulatory protein
VSWLSFSFECRACAHVFSDLIQGIDGKPDPCPRCGAEGAERLMCAPKLAVNHIPMYPGCKASMAGFAHEAKRPAEKKGRQVSMAQGKPRKR